jgi:ribosomal protein S12 methylthiotransferase
MSADYAGADVVLVNTCGFLDSAKEESLEAIGEAMAENGRVIVTGCMGEEPSIRAPLPEGARGHRPAPVRGGGRAVHEAAPPTQTPSSTWCRRAGVKLTPRHYSYLKISEGCNHKLRLLHHPAAARRSRQPPADAMLREAEKLVAAGRSCWSSARTPRPTASTSATPRAVEGPRGPRPHDRPRPRAGQLGAWVRLHYVYPYPHVDAVIPLMAEGWSSPISTSPSSTPAPKVLKAMKRPANEAKVLERIRGWREICPDIAIRSTFVVGFPGETEEDFEYPARLARGSPARPRRRLPLRAGRRAPPPTK